MAEAYSEAELIGGQRLTDKDVQAIAALMQHLAGNKSLPAKSLEQLRWHYEMVLAQGAYWVVVRDSGGTIVSMAIMTPHLLAEYVGKRFATVNDVSTLRAHEGRGLGKRVMRKLFQVAREKKFDHVDWTSSKTGAQAFYEGSTMQGWGVQRRHTRTYRWTPGGT